MREASGCFSAAELVGGRLLHSIAVPRLSKGAVSSSLVVNGRGAVSQGRAAARPFLSSQGTCSPHVPPFHRIIRCKRRAAAHGCAAAQNQHACIRTRVPTARFPVLAPRRLQDPENSMCTRSHRAQSLAARRVRRGVFPPTHPQGQGCGATSASPASVRRRREVFLPEHIGDIFLFLFDISALYRTRPTLYTHASGSGRHWSCSPKRTKYVSTFPLANFLQKPSQVMPSTSLTTSTAVALVALCSLTTSTSMRADEIWMVAAQAVAPVRCDQPGDQPSLRQPRPLATPTHRTALG